MRPQLGTFVEICAMADTGRAVQVAIDNAFNSIGQIERLLSFQNSESELSQLNRSGGRPLTLHPWTVRVLRLARAMTRDSAGLFNCTVGGSLIHAGVLPNHAQTLPLASGNADDIEITGRCVRLRRPVQITLDGIAKGFAVDLAARALRMAGIANGWINAGGDLLAFGTAAIPVQRREVDGCLAPLGILRNGAIATSTVAMQRDPRFPGYIVSSDAARPASGIWTVHARYAWRADALTKVAALAPSTQCAWLLGRFRGELVLPIQEAAA
jgi:FAD:protein FMN transferase